MAYSFWNQPRPRLSMRHFIFIAVAAIGLIIGAIFAAYQTRVTIPASTGPTNDWEAACSATDLDAAAKNRLQCNP